MGWLVHPRPCPCGSGRVARDCCGRFTRLSEADVARAYLHRQARVARDLVAPFSPGGFDGLRRELPGLPDRQATVAAALSGRAAAEVARLVSAAARRDDESARSLIRAGPSSAKPACRSLVSPWPRRSSPCARTGLSTSIWRPPPSSISTVPRVSS
jgi:hypothetical protein